NSVAVTIQRRMKGRVTLVGWIENQVEQHQPGAGPAQPLQENPPQLARPWERPLRHQLERPVVSQLLRRQRRKLQAALVDPEKHEIRRRRRLSPLAPQQILKTFFAAPRRREKRRSGEKMPKQNQSCPKDANARQNQRSCPPQRVHGGSIQGE